MGDAQLLPADRQLLSLTARLRQPYGGGPDVATSRDTLARWQDRATLSSGASSSTGPVIQWVLGANGEAESGVVPAVRPVVFKGETKSGFSVGTFVERTQVPPRQGLDLPLPELEKQLERMKTRLDVAWENSVGRQRVWITDLMLRSMRAEGEGSEEELDDGLEIGGGQKPVAGVKRTAEEDIGVSKRKRL